MKLTIHEVAGSLDLQISTIERWVRQGRIPIQKSGNDYVFSKPVIERWAKSHHLIFTPPVKKGEESGETDTEDLTPVMIRGGVYHDVEGESAAHVLENAVSRMAEIPSHIREKLYTLLIQREEMNSTGIGKGVAIPHPRSCMNEGFEKPQITTCFLKQPMDYRAVDGDPVFVLFILLSPTPKTHLHLLSRLSFCLRDNDFIRFLKSAPEPETLFTKIAEIENRLKTSS